MFHFFNIEKFICALISEKFQKFIIFFLTLILILIVVDSSKKQHKVWFNELFYSAVDQRKKNFIENWTKTHMSRIFLSSSNPHDNHRNKLIMSFSFRLPENQRPPSYTSHGKPHKKERKKPTFFSPCLIIEQNITSRGETQNQSASTACIYYTLVNLSLINRDFEIHFEFSKSTILYSSIFNQHRTLQNYVNIMKVSLIFN